MSEEIENIEEQPEIELDTRGEVEAALTAIEADTPETESEKAERLRDEKGRFSKKEDPVEPVEQTDPVEEAYEPRFNGYNKEEGEKLRALPVEIQKIIDAREEKFHRGIDQFREGHQFANEVIKSLGDDLTLLQRYNITPSNWINRLVSTERQLRNGSPEDKLRVIQGLAHEYGVNPEAITQIPFNPQEYALQQQNQQLQERLEQTRQATQQAEVQQALGMIQEFAKDRPYFDELREEMAYLFDNGLVSSLPEAYEKAIRLNDNVFAKWQQEQIGNQVMTRQNQAAKTAKSAAVSVKGGAPLGRTVQKEPETHYDAVKAAFEQLGL